MKSDRSRYSGYRFPPEIISYAVWAYHRFCLSFRDVEDLLAERGIIVSYETIRRAIKVDLASRGGYLIDAQSQSGKVSGPTTGLRDVAETQRLKEKLGFRRTGYRSGYSFLQD